MPRRAVLFVMSRVKRASLGFNHEVAIEKDAIEPVPDPAFRGAGRPSPSRGSNRHSAALVRRRHINLSGAEWDHRPTIDAGLNSLGWSGMPRVYFPYFREKERA